MKRNIVPTQNERQFGADEFIVTKTDLKGRITYANRVFMRMADYSESELLGVQHNIVRHPDMPRGAFKHLWDTIQTGREWFGFVKNMSSNGDYYWVFANVTPDYENGRVVGYFSVRRQAPRAAIDFFVPIYAEMLRIEQKVGPAQACDASLAWLSQRLTTQGLSYERLVLDLFHQSR
ncbi:PAS domain-containing protein [Thermochromatium tepidum]|uniref:PAS domain-containing protein n=1 Tax=Thermochromatium tepidum ATCC 43061 TaxID=316276 RepID=A0A6I6DZ37_THETI|nr:PAS domain-containing protein [Thermochromatium tepidum]QGU32931.1 PAS domain-containing protein [Thermochromatium tepidum ATCC 43061]